MNRFYIEVCIRLMVLNCLKEMMSRITRFAIILGIVFLLILSGFSQAFVLSVNVKEDSVNVGDEVTIEVSAMFEENHKIEDIDYIEFKMTGPFEYNCRFFPNTTAISGCEGVEIMNISSEDGTCGGYGYGGGCKINFRLLLDTIYYEPGEYTPLFLVSHDGKEIETSGKKISINSIKKVCSIRGDDGLLTIEGKEFDSKNKISFFIPLWNANKGQGYVVGQKNRDRILYRFKVTKILIDNENFMRIELGGKYKLNNQGFLEESSVLTFNKSENTISVRGTNIKVDRMKVEFKEFC